MSTKIYNGYAHPSSDLALVFNSFHAKRAKVAEVGRGIIAGTYAKLAVERIDAAVMAGTGCESPLVGIMGQVLDRQAEVKAKGRRDPDVDLETSVVLIPAVGKTLVMVWTEHEDIRQVLTEDLLSFGWWDNTEKPDDVSDDAWGERERLWNEALSRDPLSRPGACGLSVDFLPDTEIPRVGLMLENLPKLESRVRRVLVPEICKALTDEGVDVMRAVARASGQDLLADPRWVDRAAEIRARLPEITEKILRSGVQVDAPGLSQS